MEKNKKVTIYTDGGSRGNPGEAAIGVYFPEGNKKYGKVIGRATNNDAEYQAVIFALKKAKQILGSDECEKLVMEIRSDSQLIVNQLNGKFKIKEGSLGKYFIEIWNLKQDFEKVEFNYIPREENKVADSLVNEVLDQQNKEQKMF